MAGAQGDAEGAILQGGRGQDGNRATERRGCGAMPNILSNACWRWKRGFSPLLTCDGAASPPSSAIGYEAGPWVFCRGMPPSQPECESCDEADGQEEALRESILQPHDSTPVASPSRGLEPRSWETKASASSFWRRLSMPRRVLLTSRVQVASGRFPVARLRFVVPGRIVRWTKSACQKWGYNNNIHR